MPQAASQNRHFSLPPREARAARRVDGQLRHPVTAPASGHGSGFRSRLRLPATAPASGHGHGHGFRSRLRSRLRHPATAPAAGDASKAGRSGAFEQRALDSGSRASKRAASPGGARRHWPERARLGQCLWAGLAEGRLVRGSPLSSSAHQGREAPKAPVAHPPVQEHRGRRRQARRHARGEAAPGLAFAASTTSVARPSATACGAAR